MLLLGICALLGFGYAPQAWADSAVKSVQAVQQAKKVSGVVSDAMGPVIGATVMEKGTSNGTVTDLDGNFSLNVKPNAELEISYVGYKTRLIRVGSQSTFNITLEEDRAMLDEVFNDARTCRVAAMPVDFKRVCGPAPQDDLVRRAAQLVESKETEERSARVVRGPAVELLGHGLSVSAAPAAAKERPRALPAHADARYRATSRRRKERRFKPSVPRLLPFRQIYASFFSGVWPPFC